MDVHKPKSWPAWRVVLTDFVIVVLGVGVALAAQQGVEWWHWRSQVAEARQVIASEMASNVVGAIHRLRTAACTESRLAALSRILDDAARSGKLPPVGDISAPPRRAWPRGAWEALVASQTATHFPPQEFYGLSGTYKLIERMEVVFAAEGDFWRDLYTMVGPGRRLNPESEDTLRLALSRARTNNRIMGTLASQLLAQPAVQQLPFSPDNRATMTAGRLMSVASER